MKKSSVAESSIGEFQKKELISIDCFRLAAAFLVVAIHTSPLAEISETGDFILTGIIGRVAVPFFFMTSAFFLYLKSDEGKLSCRRLTLFLKKTATLYFASILLYTPLNIYSGQAKEWIHPTALLKDLLFDGTFYHLWYLPAFIIGAFIAWLLIEKRNTSQALAVSLVLYLIGLLGDSYYGITSAIPLLHSVYEGLFLVFDYTRNGLFFTPIFFVMGALIAKQDKKKTPGYYFTGFILSLALMTAEGLILHALNFQRHDSMYISLLPCMFFMFQSILSLKFSRISPDNVIIRNIPRYFRSMSMIIYIIHPAMIVVVRGFAKVVGLQEFMVHNSLVLFLMTAFCSFFASLILTMLQHALRAFYYGNMEKEKEREKDRAWAEINLANLHHNIIALQNVLPPKCRLMAVVKANAYGHGAKKLSSYLSGKGIQTFAVATLLEGIELRRNGVKGEILILGFTPASRVSDLVRYRLTQTAVDSEHAMELNAALDKSFKRNRKQLQIHIKVDTGMHRLGENAENIDAVLKIFYCKNLRVTGIFTHLCVSDSTKRENVEMTELQIQRFDALLSELKSIGITIPTVHVQSTYGVFNYPGLQYSHARIGIALYGVLSTEINSGTSDVREELIPDLDLHPVLSLKSRVVLIRSIPPGEGVGYGQEFTAQNETKLAVIPIGYADGYPRSLSGKSHVLIRGHRFPVIGRICMDQLMVDITGCSDICKGDVVTLIGKDGAYEITVEQTASQAGTITNELLSRLSSRLERVYL